MSCVSTVVCGKVSDMSWFVRNMKDEVKHPKEEHNKQMEESFKLLEKLGGDRDSDTDSVRSEDRFHPLLHLSISKSYKLSSTDSPLSTVG